MAKGDKSFYSVEEYDYLNVDYDEETGNEIYDGNHHVRIDYVVVAKKERGQGKGRELLRAAIAEAKTYNLPIYIVASQLEPETDIERLVAFYESEGFSVDGTIGDEVLMYYYG
jgi:GNAT superfamily N-acetyltransferase